MSPAAQKHPEGWSVDELVRQAREAEVNALASSVAPVRDCWLKMAAIYRRLAVEAGRGDPPRRQLTAKQKLALSAFDVRKEVRRYHLPTFVGPRTMDQLVALGLVEPIDPTGPFARRGWRLVDRPNP